MSIDNMHKAFEGWKAIKSGKRSVEPPQPKNDVDDQKITPELKRKLLMEAQKEADNAIEDPAKHLRNAYKQKIQAEKASKTVKLDPPKTLMLLCEVSEKGGKILSVEEAGFNVYKITYII